MKKNKYILIITIWSFWFIIFISSIIVMSIPANNGNFFKGVNNINGWDILKNNGIWYMLTHFKPNVMNWWATSDSMNVGLKSFTAFIVIICNILFVVLPFLILVFSFVSYKLYRFANYPKSIELIDYNHKCKKTQKMIKKLNKKIKKKPNNKEQYEKQLITLNKDLSEYKNKYKEYYLVWKNR